MQALRNHDDTVLEALAARLADECAHTLLAYYQAENHDTDAYADHEEAVRRYEETFPQLCDWEWLVPRALLDEIRRHHP